ncbi:MAG: hypothetical protein WBL23_00435 [Salinisphaera sp.]|uniref:hypothetical protein n=1 Tax=Salinisphaera sp. TaxID=1914330 RepID=UPI003C7BC8D2
MSTARHSKNRRVGALIVVLIGVVGAIYLGIGARDATLDRAVSQASAGLHPMLVAPASGDPQAVVHRLVTTNASAMAFLTVRNRDHRLVASDGAWSSWFAGMASRATVRAWRAWMYRTLCADTFRSIVGGADVHAGVPWWRVFASAGLGFWLALLLSIFGLLIFERERRGQSTEPSEADARMTLSVSRLRKLSSPRRSPIWRERLQRIRAGVRREGPREAGPAAPAVGFQPIGQRARPQTSGAPEGPATQQADQAGPTSAAREQPGDAVAPGGEAVSEEAEAADTQPSFGQYLLRFQPIWRGAMDGLLAGAVVRFVGADDARPLTVDELIAAGVVESDPPQTLATGLTRRLVTLQSNWRTLELPRVPLMVPLPESLFAFERAEDVWGEALSQYEPAAGELVFCVERIPEAGGTALPVRWAVAEQQDRAGRTWYCVRSGMDAEPSEEEAEDARSSMGGGKTRFVMPASRDEAAGNAHNALSPRAFARLMSRSELAPL